MELELFTMQQVSAITKRGYSTLRNDLKKGKIHFVKLGRLVRIPKGEVDRILVEGL